MNRLPLLEAIQAAFSEQPVPDSQALLGPVDAQNEESAEKFRKELAGQSWRSLTPEFAKEWWAWFGYLKPEVYCYYLPALLAAPLKGDANDDDLMSSIVFALRPCFEEVSQQDERTAIIHYLEYNTRDEYEKVKIQQALANYWRPSLQAPMS